MVRHLYILGLCLLLPGAAGFAKAEPAPLRIAVLDDAPPMSYLDAAGNLTGFSYSIAKALCADMKLQCEFRVTKLDYLIDDLAAGHFDIAAIGLLNTPERRQKIIFSQPFYRSISLWFAKPGVQPGSQGIRISAFRGSVQENYVKAQGWETISAQTDIQMIEQLSAGVAQAIIAPLMTSFNLQKNPRFLQLGLTPTVLRAPELEGDASFGISPKRADIKEPLDKALENIRQNGTYDRINTKFLPFRVY
ncbi:MAG TPA: transporter substrate-binding domain-containing protein [Azonexus sp.]|nr:transporter substrate-binding domain-containing protein [Azonexus sp.]